MSTEDKHKLVIDHWFVNGFNGAAAYREVYPKSSVENSRKSFQQLCTLPHIEDYIKQKHQNARESLKLSHEDVLIQLDNIRSANIRDYVKLVTKEIEQGDADNPIIIKVPVLEFTPFDELTEKQLSCIEEISNTKFGMKIKLKGTQWSLDMIAKHIGFYKEDNKQKATVIDTSGLSIEEKKAIAKLHTK